MSRTGTDQRYERAVSVTCSLHNGRQPHTPAVRFRRRADRGRVHTVRNRPAQGIEGRVRDPRRWRRGGDPKGRGTFRWFSRSRGSVGWRCSPLFYDELPTRDTRNRAGTCHHPAHTSKQTTEAPAPNIQTRAASTSTIARHGRPTRIGTGPGASPAVTAAPVSGPAAGLANWRMAKLLDAHQRAVQAHLKKHHHPNSSTAGRTLRLPTRKTLCGACRPFEEVAPTPRRIGPPAGPVVVAECGSNRNEPSNRAWGESNPVAGGG